MNPTKTRKFFWAMAGVYGLLAVQVSGQASADFLWALGAQGSSDEQARAVAADATANVFVAGYFSGNESIGSSNFVSAGAEDIFLAKYDATGHFLWARQAGGPGYDEGRSLAVDSLGNVYLTGSFQNTAVFGPTNVVSAGSNDVFIAKYNPDGNLLWVRRAGGNGNDAGHGICLSAQDDVYVAGSFDNAASFGALTLPNNSKSDDLFVVKCSSSGEFLWARKAGGPDDDTASGIAFDGSTSNLYVTGFFSGTASFGSTNLISSGSNSLPQIYLAQYDPAGNLLWVRQAGGSGDDRGNSIAADAGNIWITGQFSGTSSFSGTNLVANGNGPDIFVARYNSAGTLLWARKAGGSSVIYGDAGFGIATDHRTNAFVAGYFSGTAAFSGTNVPSIGFQDMFCAKYNGGGDVCWVKTAGAVAGNDFGQAVSLDLQGNVLIAGFFLSSTITFGPTTLTNTGGRDWFLAKVGELGPTPDPPHLTVTASAGQVWLSWPASAAGFHLQSTTNLANPVWAPTAGQSNVVGTNVLFSAPLGVQEYFRLKR